MKRAFLVLMAISAITWWASTASADHDHHHHHRHSYSNNHFHHHSFYGSSYLGGGCGSYRPSFYGGPSYYEHRTYYSTRPSFGYGYGNPGYISRSPRIGLYFSF